MDKTTTWLVRGAASIVIIVGVSYFAKPQITKLTNYISKSRSEKNEYKKLSDEYKKLSDEDKNDYDINKAQQRCLNLEEISYSDFIKKLDNNEIRKFFETPIGTQINTSKGNYIVKENKSSSLIPDEIRTPGEDAIYELRGRNIKNPQYKFYKKAFEHSLDTGQDLYIPEILKMVCR